MAAENRPTDGAIAHDEWAREQRAAGDAKSDPRPLADERGDLQSLDQHLMGAAELAHDIRSPIGSILLLADTLRREHSGPLLPLQRRQIEIIYSAALALGSFAEDVMDVAQDGSALMDATSTPFSIADTLAWLQDVLEPVASAKELEFRVRATGADLRIGYPLALQRVLLNLLTNALKFTQSGSVELAVRSLRGGPVRFVVTDTGPGMPPDVLAMISAASGCAPATRREGVHVKAFGLTVCIRLLRLMGSRLVADTPACGGTVCRFDLDLPVYAPGPYADSPPRGRRRAGKPRAPGPGGSGRGRSDRPPGSE